MGLLPKMPDAEEDPPLMMSATGEDDEDLHHHTTSTKDTILWSSTLSKTLSSNHPSAAASFVNRYEHMVQSQAGEDAAVWQHVRPCLERVQALIDEHGSTNTSTTTAFHHAQSSSQGSHEKNLIHLSDLKTILPHLRSSSSSASSPKKEPWTSDRQLMLVLQVLAEEHNNNNNTDISLTWAEVVQCYKACIGGMQTLERLPGPSQERDRCRQRTMAMLALFASSSSSRTLPGIAKDAMESRSVNTETVNSSKARVFTFVSISALLVVALVLWAPLSSPYITMDAFSFSSSNIHPTPNVLTPDTIIHDDTAHSNNDDKDENMPFAAPRQSPKPWLQPKSRVIGTATISSYNHHPNRAMPETSTATRESTQVTAKTTTTSHPLVHDTVIGALVGGPAMALLAQAYQTGAWAAVGSTVVFGAGILSLASAVIQFLRQRWSARVDE